MKTGACKHIEGYSYAEEVCFRADVSGRDVGVVVPMGTLLRLAEIFKHCQSAGHSVWHLHNPERDLPCSSCFAAKAEAK